MGIGECFLRALERPGLKGVCHRPVNSDTLKTLHGFVDPDTLKILVELAGVVMAVIVGVFTFPFVADRWWRDRRKSKRELEDLDASAAARQSLVVKATIEEIKKFDPRFRQLEELLRKLPNFGSSTPHGSPRWELPSELLSPWGLLIMAGVVLLWVVGGALLGALLWKVIRVVWLN